MKFQTKDKRTMLEKEIDRLIESMSKLEQDDPEYKKKTETLEKLISINQKCTNMKDGREKLSPNTLAVVVGGMLEMVIIMNYERAHVIATKAFGRILRGRA